MNLIDTLYTIGAALGLDADSLNAYAAEDTYGGFLPDKDDGCMIGSLFRVEGQTLYALIRALKPKAAVEIGSFAGCSTAHLAAALEANGAGKLTAIDNQVLGVAVNIPDELAGRVTVVNTDGRDWLSARKASSVDFIFEDADHGAELTEAIWTEAKRVLKPGGVIVSHDALHWVVGAAVMAGIAAAGVKPLTVLTEPSDCGLAIWRKPE